MKQFASLFFLLIIGITPIQAQFGFLYHDSIPVFIGGDSISLPWVGGFNHAQFSSFDFDFDGEEDLFVFDRSANQIRVFVRRFDDQGQPFYKYVHNARSKFPQDVRYRAAMVDFNLDGKKDLFTYGIGGVKVYRNVGNATDGLQWVLEKNLLRTNYLGTNSNLYVSSIDIPAYVDVDGDGDIDILTFHIGGQRVEYHKNMSMENYGTPDSLEFVLKNECWGQFVENEFNNSVTLFATQGPCGGGSTIPDPQKNARHSGSCLLAIDLNEDLVMDLVLGDVSHDNLTKLINGGAAPNQNSPMISQDPNFPSNTTPVSLSTFPCGFYVDVDHDGVNDLVVGSNAANISQNYRSIMYYKNLGTNEAPVFSYVQNDFLQEDMIENGRGSIPIFVDVNGDGLKDMLVANNYRYKPVLAKETTIAYYQNTGTIEHPEFTWVSNDWMGFMSSSYGLRVFPSFGDLDGDGDLDMIIGSETGYLHYYQNTGGGGAMNFSTPPVIQMTDHTGALIQVSSYSTPYLFDVDNDGLLDLLVGQRMGGMLYYKNIGTSAVPNFEWVTSNFGNMNISTPVNPESYHVPQLIRQNDTLHLFLGCRAGTIHYFKDIENNLFDGGIFTQVSSAYAGINTDGFSAPSIAYLTEDSSFHMAVGGDLGGVWMFKADPFSGVIEDTLQLHQLSELDKWSVYPNPSSNGHFTLEPENSGIVFQVDIVDVTGRQVHKKNNVFGQTQLNIGHADSGIYLVRLFTPDGMLIGVRRVMVTK